MAEPLHHAQSRKKKLKGKSRPADPWDRKASKVPYNRSKERKNYA